MTDSNAHTTNSQSLATKRQTPYHGNRYQGTDLPLFRSHNNPADFSQDLTSQKVGGVSCQLKMADKASVSY